MSQNEYAQRVNGVRSILDHLGGLYVVADLLKALSVADLAGGEAISGISVQFLCEELLRTCVRIDATCGTMIAACPASASVPAHSGPEAGQ